MLRILSTGRRGGGEAQRLIRRWCCHPSFATTSTSFSAEGLGERSINVSDSIEAKIGRNLHLQKDHPLNMIKQKIENHFSGTREREDDIYDASYKFFDDLSPVVDTASNFDNLLVPSDHVSRSRSDTFYIDETTVLRTHTSAHQTELIKSGHNAFLCTGDVYRRDTVDASHYPVFHQMEGVRVFDTKEISVEELGRDEAVERVQAHLKLTLEGMVRSVFGNVDIRWVDAYFPFTDPSLEMEIYFQNEWLEVLGCGVIEQDILTHAGRQTEIGWAFGLGLERLAMVLYDIPDIRLFWSGDDRFLSQFSSKKGDVKFSPFSKYPPCLKDISFWIADDFHENDIHDAARSVAGDLVEEVKLIDDFQHPKTGRSSHCYRVVYRSMERNLTNDEIDRLQEELRGSVQGMGCELR
eukprot:g2513.t1